MITRLCDPRLCDGSKPDKPEFLDPSQRHAPKRPFKIISMTTISISTTDFAAAVALAAIEARATDGQTTKLTPDLDRIVDQALAVHGMTRALTDNHFIWKLVREGKVRVVGPGEYLPNHDIELARQWQRDGSAQAGAGL
jgi:hypothetical protein